MKSLNMIGIPLKKIGLLFFASFFLQGLTIPAYPQPGSWAEPVNVSNTMLGSWRPDMAIGPDGRIHVVWDDYTRLGDNIMRDILYSVKDGNTWSDPIQLSSMDTTYSIHAHVAVDSYGHSHVIWNHRAFWWDADIYYTTETDSGWTEPVNLSDESNCSYDPDIALDSNDIIYVVWSDYYSGSSDIVYRYKVGGAWSDLSVVMDDTVTCTEPRLCIDSQDNLQVIYEKKNPYHYDIFHTKYDGENWSESFNVSQSPDLGSTDNNFALDNYDNPHIVWTERIDFNYFEIFYNSYDGVNWGSPENVTDLNYVSILPTIAVNDNDIICLLFRFSLENENPFVNYCFEQNGVWTYPDTLNNHYSGSTSDITADENGNFHACISLDFIDYNNIGYTYYRCPNSIEVNTNYMVNNKNLICYPNPANNSVNIGLDLNSISENELSIYNVAGQLVKSFDSSVLQSGDNIINWDCSNNKGISVNSGVYFVRLKSGEYRDNKQIIIIK